MYIQNKKNAIKMYHIDICNIIQVCTYQAMYLLLHVTFPTDLGLRHFRCLSSYIRTWGNLRRIYAVLLGHNCVNHISDSELRWIRNNYSLSQSVRKSISNHTNGSTFTSYNICDIPMAWFVQVVLMPLSSAGNNKPLNHTDLFAWCTILFSYHLEFHAHDFNL